MTRSRLAATATLVALGLVLGAMWAVPVHAASDDRGRALLTRARTAAYTQEWDGEVVVHWRDASGAHERTVAVSSRAGVVRVGNGSVVATEDRTMRRTRAGWNLLGTDVGARAPDPAHKYDLRVRRGAPVAGLATWRLDARAKGRVRHVLFFDARTGVLLRRDQLDRSGRVERRVAFVRFETYAPSRVSDSTTTTSARRGDPDGAPAPLDRPPEGLPAPKRVGDGFRRVSVLQPTAGGDVQLYYSDGLVGVSVFVDRGAVDWEAMPAGWTRTRVDGHPARAYATAEGNAVVWEADGKTFTCVSHASVADVSAFATAFDDPADDGWLTRAGRFVTEPFSWE